MEINRPSKERYYLDIARAVTGRAVCFRRYSGAIIVLNDQIVATGYTGSPRKTLSCFARGYCLRNKFNVPSGQRYELCASVHAEQNAIINAARAGVSLLNGDMYIFGQTLEGKPIDSFPCFICKKMVINAGILRVICSTHDDLMKVFHVEDWTRDWQDPNREIIDDKDQYGEGLKIEK